MRTIMHQTQTSSEWVKAIRTALKLSQHRLAAVLQCHPASIYKWETGQCEPRLVYREKLIKLSKKAKKEANNGSK